MKMDYPVIEKVKNFTPVLRRVQQSPSRWRWAIGIVRF